MIVSGKILFRAFFVLFLFFISSNISFANTDSSNVFISKIVITGNKVTKETIIQREILFSESTHYEKNELNELIVKTKENLLNTSLFNFVEIKTTGKSDAVQVEIDVVERWYIWPYPILEHSDRNLSSFLDNGDWSRIDYGLFLLIDNFRGRREILKLRIIAGYQPRYTLSYYKPYIDKSKKWGAGILLDYLSNHEAPYATSENKIQYLKMRSSLVKKETQVGVYATYRPAHYNNHQLVTHQYIPL